MTQTELGDIDPSFQRDRLEEVHQLLVLKEKMEKQIEDAEKALKQMSSDYRELTENTIPDLMREMGLESFKTPDGKSVSIEKIYSASITAANEAEAFRWLEESGNEAIIKNNFIISLKASQQEEAKRAEEALKESNLPFIQKKAVHPSTLKSFVKEKIEAGEQFPQSLFSVYIGNRVKVRQ